MPPHNKRKKAPLSFCHNKEGTFFFIKINHGAAYFPLSQKSMKHNAPPCSSYYKDTAYRIVPLFIKVWEAYGAFVL